jgi:uncharacterized protein (DUF2132 family)
VHAARLAQLSSQPKNPLHGITLERIVTELAQHLGWPRMASEVRIRCFELDPSVKSSLTFLRRTPWARAEVEALYLRHTDEIRAKEKT